MRAFIVVGALACAAVCLFPESTTAAAFRYADLKPSSFAPACVNNSQCNNPTCASCACTGGACVCADGYIGPNCMTPFCVNRTTGCSNHGTCVVTTTSRTCTCDVGFFGEHCEKQCPLDCVHGGQPDVNCTTCVKCLGGWTGQTCNTFNTSIDNVTLLSMYTTLFTNVAADQQTYLAQIVAAHPTVVPGYNSVGAAFYPVPKVDTPPTLGLLMYNYSFHNNLTISDGAGVKYAVPDQIKATPGPSTPASTSTGYRQLTDYVSKQTKALKAGTGLTGGFKGLHNVANVNARYYERGVSLSQYRTDVTAYTLQIVNNPPLNSYARAALLSLPDVVNNSTRPIFEAFLTLFGTSVTTTQAYGGYLEEFVAWYNCIWQGSSPQQPGTDAGNVTGLQHCLLNDQNFAASVANRSYGQLNSTVSTTRVGGSTTCAPTDVACWEKSIPASFKTVATVSRSAPTRLSSLLPALGGNATALASMEAEHLDTPIAAADAVAAEAVSVNLVNPRFVFLHTDLAGVCTEAPMEPGDSWPASCVSPGEHAYMQAGSDGAPVIGLSGAIASPNVSCGCAVSAVPAGSQTYGHLCFACGLGGAAGLAQAMADTNHIF